MNWLHYLLEANIYLGVFYLLYFLLLNNETHYKLNRAYLLITCIVAYIIPVIQVGMLKPAGYGGQTVTILLNRNLRPGVDTYHLNLQDFVLYAYIIGASATLGIFIFKLIQLAKLTRAKKSLLDDKYKVVSLQGSNTAFSFFNYVFIGTKVSGTDTILRHELVHIDQKHSFDIVFLELVKIISWFNPFIYLLQRSIKSVHEYIADEQTAAYENDALAYSSFLVSNAYGISGTSITHSFFNYNLLKKRIIMLNQKRSGNLARLKYLAALPVCAGLLCSSTLGFSKTYGWVDIAPQTQTDTIKLMKPADAKMSPTAQKINSEIDVQLKKAQAQPKITNIKLSPLKAEKVQEITIDPIQNTGKLADGSKAKVIPDGGTAKNNELADVKTLTIVPDQAQKTPPPPPPMTPFLAPANGFVEFSKYIAKYTRFPTVAVENKLVGSVIVKFNINNSHKINNITLVKGFNTACDGEVLRVFKNFTGNIPEKSGSYKMAVTFNLSGVDAPKSASESLGSDPSFAGEVVVAGYPKK